MLPKATVMVPFLVLVFTVSTSAEPLIELKNDLSELRYTINYVRGFVRWQPNEKSEWRRLKANQRLPISGKLAVGVDAVVTMTKFVSPRRFDQSGVYDLQSGSLTNYLPRDSDPPGIRSMRRFNTPASATVLAFKGHVRWRPSESESWRQIKVGTALSQKAHVQIGFGSFVSLFTSEDRVVTIDRMCQRSIDRIVRIGYIKTSQ